ncbi:MAG: glycosyl transferase [Bacteroidota bacterium]
MTYNFCTLFNSFYLSRGLVTYESLIRAEPDAHLYIVTFDDKAFEVLTQLNLKQATLIPLTTLEKEVPELLAVKADRGFGEYCWTSSSVSTHYIIQKYRLNQCTYIDADMYFYQSPKILLEEIPSEYSAMITEHRYAPHHQKLGELRGRYCVQFMVFDNDEQGMKVLTWWKDACLDWCYNRMEDGKFGDQKYLDSWTQDFAGVWELQHLGGGVAPWNMEQYDFFEQNGRIQLRDKQSKKEYPLVFFHYHGLKFFDNGKVYPKGRYTISDAANCLLFEPYIAALEDAKRRIQAIDDSFDPHGSNTVVPTTTFNQLKGQLHHVKRAVQSVFQ